MKPNNGLTIPELLVVFIIGGLAQERYCLDNGEIAMNFSALDI